MAQEDYTLPIIHNYFSNENLGEIREEVEEILRKARPSLQLEQAVSLLQGSNHLEPVSRPYYSKI